MTTAEQVTHDLGSDRHPLAPGASADVVRQALLPEDRPQLDLELREAGDDEKVREDRIDHWRHVAIVQADREGFAAMVRRVAERNTGQPTPLGESLEATRQKAGL